MIFKVGERVKCIDNYNCNPTVIDQEGWIVYADPTLSYVTVEFDNDIDGHDGHNYENSGNCWEIPIGRGFLIPVNTSESLIEASEEVVLTLTLPEGVEVYKGRLRDGDKEFYVTIEREVSNNVQ